MGRSAGLPEAAAAAARLRAQLTASRPSRTMQCCGRSPPTPAASATRVSLAGRCRQRLTSWKPNRVCGPACSVGLVHAVGWVVPQSLQQQQQRRPAACERTSAAQLLHAGGAVVKNNVVHDKRKADQIDHFAGGRC